MNEFVNRVLKPVAIPLVAAVFVGVLVFSFAQIMLAVPEIGSTSLALLISAEILGVSAVIAAGTKLKAAQKGLLLVLGLGLIAGGGVSTAIGAREIEPHAEGIPIVARDIAFDKETLEVPADHEFVLEFNNQDAVPHNVAIYGNSALENPQFVGEIFTGPATRAYTVPAIPAGSYYFHCDVHPNMNGTVVAGEGGGGGHGGETPGGTPSPGHATPSPAEGSPSPGSTTPTEHAGATEVTVRANRLAFDTTQLDLAANTPVTLTLINEESAPHNLSIYEGNDASGRAVLKEDFFPGPDQRTWTIDPTPPGNYYFQCDVHPNMKGTAVFH